MAAAALYVGIVTWSRESADTPLQTFGIDPVATRFVVPGLAPILPTLAVADRAAIDRTTLRLEPELVAGLSEEARCASRQASARCRSRAP